MKQFRWEINYKYEEANSFDGRSQIASRIAFLDLCLKATVLDDDDDETF